MYTRATINCNSYSVTTLIAIEKAILPEFMFFIMIMLHVLE